MAISAVLSVALPLTEVSAAKPSDLASPAAPQFRCCLYSSDHSQQLAQSAHAGVVGQSPVVLRAHSESSPSRGGYAVGQALVFAAEENTSPTCGGQSFTASTMVVLASGAAIAISKLRKGEKVLATNTKTGKTTAETVAAVLVHHDTDKYDLTVKTGSCTAVIDTTRSHLFFDQDSKRWVKAAALRHGIRLRTPGGRNVTVLGGHDPKTATGWMWDLTVTQDHDFYIQAATTAVLVHNCDEAPATFENQLPGTLDSERATAEELGVRASEPGTAAFDEAVQGGRVKFAVNTAGELRAVPEFVQGQEISHAVIFGGEPVVAAGVALPRPLVLAP